jgi:6-phosphofructokinase 1
MLAFGRRYCYVRHMKNAFYIPRLGPCRIPSPLDSKTFVSDQAAVLCDATREGCKACRKVPNVLEMAGPRRKIFFQPRKTRAAIVTCGGLCPGLNDVIRAVTMVLWYRYGVQNILGLRYGYEGLIDSFKNKPMLLTPEKVEDIHQDGGTMLGTSRGPQDVREMVDFLVRNKINILFTVGGDGTQRGALDMCMEIKKRRLPISIVGIPKTIDNDLNWTTRTFGFETAVAMSRDPITCAHMEAKGVKNGIGLVKLMGRESGFVAVYATLASSDVNLVLIPESPFSLNKVMEFLRHRLAHKSHAVIVVAEGAGQELVNADGTDASGNRKLGDIGIFLKNAITEYFSSLHIPAAVRYFDPSYSIRSSRATPDDSVFCFQLGEKSVHAAMTGRTAMVTSIWNGHFVHVPLEQAVKTRKKVDTCSLIWQSVLDNTGQPAVLTD